MFHYFRFFVLVPFVLALAFLPGCGKKGPKVYLVEGIVTVDGKTVEGADVSFVPKQASSSPDDLSGPLLASGKTDVNGKYTLSTTRGSVVGGGTTPGEYKITIVKKKMTNAPTAPLAAGQRHVPQYEYGVPRDFEDSNKSKIFVEVVKGKNSFNFDLKSDGTFEIKQ
ncbi:MAG: hypothetical protein FWD31_10365 [Planctomycetaceae bacterium]|nr:hypothetical protein [Planctomycetaceae bacterium]